MLREQHIDDDGKHYIGSKRRVKHSEYYFAMDEIEHADIFADVRYVWEALSRLPSYIEERLQPGIAGDVAEGAFVADNVWIGPGARVEPGAMIKGPSIIGAGTVVQHGAYIRENSLISAHCVVGHASEIKHTIMLEGSRASHFNFVGDSIVGRNVNLGAGVRLANFKNDGTSVQVRLGEEVIETGLAKFGAVLGDGVHMGCNAVTSPGTLIGPESRVYATALLRGAYAARSLIKVRPHLEVVTIE